MSRSTLGVIAFIAAVIVAALFFRQPESDAPTPPTAPPAKADVKPVAPAPPPVEPTEQDEPSEAMSLHGRVVTDDGEQPVGGCVVMLRAHEDDAEPLTTLTDTDGRFAFEDVRRGTFALSATAAGYMPSVDPHIDIGDAERLLLTLRLKAGGLRVSGVITDMLGGAVDSATIRAVPQSGFVTLRQHESFASFSDEDGNYRLDVAPGRYRIEVAHPDYAPTARMVEVSSGESEQDFALVPTGSIEGIVVTQDTHRPVPGAKVSWRRLRLMMLPGGGRQRVPSGGGSVLADERGHFRINGLKPGHVTLTARAEGLATAEAVGISVAIAEAVRDVELAVGTAVSLSGRVVDAADASQGIADATVTVDVGPEQGLSATTDAEGNFRLDGTVPGRARIWASADGYAPNFPGVTLDISPGHDDIEIALDAGLRIRGRVDPATRARVTVELSPENVSPGGGMFVFAGLGGVETGDDGAFEIGPVKPGLTTLLAKAADGSTGRVDVEVGPTGADDVVITLQERAVIAGVVQTASGAPLAEASVMLRRQDGPASAVSLTINGRGVGLDSGTTATDGSFEIVGVEPGRYGVEILGPTSDPLTLLGDADPALDITDSDQRGLVYVVDAHDGTIDGTVTSADGVPLPEVWVTLARHPAPLPSGDHDDDDGPRAEMSMVIATGQGGSSAFPPTLTDDAGHFAFGGLRAGKYEVVAEAGGGTSRVRDNAEPDATLTLKLQPLASVAGKVTVNGRALDDFSVSLAGPSPSTTRVRDDGGAFELTRLDPGEYTVTVHGGGGSGSTTFTAEAGKTATADITMEALATVTGKVVDAAGEPVVGAMVMIGEAPSGDSGSVTMEDDGSTEPITTDKEGAFEAHCSGGARLLIVLRPGVPQPSVFKPFVAESGQNVDLGVLGPGDPSPAAPAK